MTPEIAEIYNILDVFSGPMSSKTLVAARRSLERDHDVLPPVRRPYAVSALRWSATCGGTRSTIRKCQHSDILQPPSVETPMVGTDGGRSGIHGARPDDQLQRWITAFVPFLAERGLAVCGGTPHQ